MIIGLLALILASLFTGAASAFGAGGSVFARCVEAKLQARIQPAKIFGGHYGRGRSHRLRSNRKLVVVDRCPLYRRKLAVYAHLFDADQ